MAAKWHSLSCEVCGKDYQRKRKTKTCSRECSHVATRAVAAAKFHSQVKRAGPDDCWDWQGSGDAHGYGRTGKTRAHRRAWELANGPVPAGLLVRHTCDRPICVNPAHLLTGTHADNMEDKNRRNRCSRGSSTGNSKLTEAMVAAGIKARANGETCEAIAARYSVSVTAMSKALKGDTWAHVKGPRLRGDGRKGAANHKSTISDADVREIRALVAGGMSQTAAGKRFGLGQSTVWQMVKRNTWKHVT